MQLCAIITTNLGVQSFRSKTLHLAWEQSAGFYHASTPVVSLRMRIDEHLRVYKKEVERMAKRKGRSREFIDDSDDPEDTGVSS